MLRTPWFAATLVTVLWSAAPDGASAQIGAYPMRVRFEPFVDVTYTGNGESIRCTTPELEGDVVAETLLEPEIGNTNTAFSQIYCGHVTISILRYLTVTHVSLRDDNINVPDWADFRTQIEVLFEDGESVVVHDGQGRLSITEGTGHWPYYGETNNIPGVVFHNIVDDISASMEQ